MLHRTVIARCDATEVMYKGGSRDCFSNVELDPYSTQPYVDLARVGWKSVSTLEGIKLLCPRHQDQELV